MDEKNTKSKARLSLPWALLALAAALAACLLCALGASRGVLYARYSAVPEESTAAFFDCLCAGDYAGAGAWLDGGADLGLDRLPEDPSAALAAEALRASYRWQPEGPAETDGLFARQQLRFSCLDLPALQRQIRPQVDEELRRIVESRSRREVYDENNNYLPQVTDEAYAAAVAALTERAAEFTRTETLTLQLRYDAGVWRIQADEALLNALCGFAAG